MSLIFLQQLVELSTPSELNHIYYKSRLNLVEAHLYGPSRAEEYIEESMTNIKEKKPSEWRLPDVKLIQFIAIHSPKKIQSFIEDSLSSVPVEYLGELLVSLYKCYNSSERKPESLHCLKLASTLLYKHWGRCPSY